LKIDDVNIDIPDTSLHDCIINTSDNKYFVNVKITNTERKSESRNDIAAVEKLFMQYATNEYYKLIYACFGIRFIGLEIFFDDNYLIVFSPQFLPIYINPRNDKIQANYKHKLEYRTRNEFLELLKNESKSIVL